MADTDTTRPEREASDPGRRSFCVRATGVAAAVVGGYTGFAGIAGRYVYPAHSTQTLWLYVSDLASVKVGDAIAYRTPAGAPVTIARRESAGTADDFVALSSTCPHLGCRVHWEPNNNRFFCPCHNGVFDPEGGPVSGPPADADQSLGRYPLKVEGGLLFIEVPADSLPRSAGGGVGGVSA